MSNPPPLPPKQNHEKKIKEKKRLDDLVLYWVQRVMCRDVDDMYQSQQDEMG